MFRFLDLSYISSGLGSEECNLDLSTNVRPRREILISLQEFVSVNRNTEYSEAVLTSKYLYGFRKNLFGCDNYFM